MRFFLCSVVFAALSLPAFSQSVHRLQPEVDTSIGHVYNTCYLAFKDKGAEPNAHYNEGYCDGIALGAFQAMLITVMRYEAHGGASQTEHAKCLSSQVKNGFASHRIALLTALDAERSSVVQATVPGIIATTAVQNYITRFCAKYEN